MDTSDEVFTKTVTMEDRKPITAMRMAMPFKLNMASLMSLSTDSDSFTSRQPLLNPASNSSTDKKKALANRQVPFSVYNLVEPGGFEPPSASTPLSVLHA